MLEAGELIAARAHPEDVRAVGELVGKDSETPFHDLSGDGVTRSGRVRRIVVGGCPISPGKNVVVIRVDGMDKGKTKKETHQETSRSLSKCRKRQKVTKSDEKCTDAYFQKPEVHFPEVKRP